jgi:hypothetical protein
MRVAAKPAMVKCSSVMVTVSSHNTLLICLNETEANNAPLHTRNITHELQHGNCVSNMDFQCSSDLVSYVCVLKNNTKPHLKNVCSESSLSLRIGCFKTPITEVTGHGAKTAQLWFYTTVGSVMLFCSLIYL